MNKRKRQRLDGENQAISGFFISLVFFLCGIFLGIFSARALDANGALVLRESMMALVSEMTGEAYQAPSFLSAFWLVGRYHLLVVFLGFSVLGVMLLPFLAAVRGFYLSFSIAALVRAFGSSAYPLAFSLFGLWALFTVPTFFFLLNGSFATALALARSLFSGPKVFFWPLYGKRFLKVTIVSFVFLALIVLLELQLTPLLLTWAVGFL